MSANKIVKQKILIRMGRTQSMCLAWTGLVHTPGCRFDIEELFKQTESAFKTLCVFAPKEKAEELDVHVVTLRNRLEVLHTHLGWDETVLSRFLPRSTSSWGTSSSSTRLWCSLMGHSPPWTSGPMAEHRSGGLGRAGKKKANCWTINWNS